MKPEVECGGCMVHWVYDRAVPHTADKDVARLVRGIVDVLLKEVSPDANLGALCNSTVYAASAVTPGMGTHYDRLKLASNENARRLLPEAVAYILDASTAQEGFERSCLLAAAANVSSLGAPTGGYTFDEMNRLMAGRETASSLVVGDVYGAIKTAQRILYVTDNAGEIGFDALVLAQLKAMAKHVTLVVKEKTFFEDATLSDTLFFDLDRLVDRVVKTGGFVAPAQLEPHVAEALHDADLIMSKGTGSYEALQGEHLDKPIIFMLKIKCQAIARQTALDIGKIVVKLEPSDAGKVEQRKVKVKKKGKTKT